MEANVIQKYASKSYSQLHDTAKRWFNKYIRLRDTDEFGYGICVSSGQRLKYGTENCQAGHLFSAGKYKSMEFNEDNVNLQGKSDNYYGHGNEAQYTINLVKKIGNNRVFDLQMLAEISKRTPFKEDRFSIIETIEKYKVKVKKEAKSKMFKV